MNYYGILMLLVYIRQLCGMRIVFILGLKLIMLIQGHECRACKNFNTRNFNQGSAILKIKDYNPKFLIVQHLPVKERENKIETNRMRNGYIIDTLTSVDIHEIAKIGGKLIEFYEGVIYRENFIVSPFRSVIDELFALRQKYKDENNDVMQLLVKLLLNSLYGENLRKDIEDIFACKSEYRMMSEYDES